MADLDKKTLIARSLLDVNMNRISSDFLLPLPINCGFAFCFGVLSDIFLKI